MPNMTRKSWFWIAQLLFSLMCLLYVGRNFDRAFPFIRMDVKMDRQQALRRAVELAAQHQWAPQSNGVQDYRQAVQFLQDSSTQNFVELEAGGPSALTQLLKEGIYYPYRWRVRHFAEGKTNETQIEFAPDGRPYAFREKLSEDDPGAAIPAPRARAIAEKAVAGGWAVDLRAYRLVEQNQEVRRGKRVDHSFIYERDTPTVGEGRYRLKLMVSGDRFTELSQFVKIPDGYFRRYSSLRSANETVSSVAFAAIALLYGVGGCIIALIWLARSHWVRWKMALWMAGLIGVLSFAESINSLPLIWMGYDTAIAERTFLLSQISRAAQGGLLQFILVLIPAIAAESLTRRAFPSHPQLWRIFSRDSASSKQFLGRVLGAYLLLAFEFAYVTWIYQFGSKHLGWWNPSETMFHPDALAAYLPWLTSVSNSLHAGFWEECLFRAVPLAGAALLGQRFGARRAWIAVAFVLQAVIFGAAHASYPTLPSYARMVELIVPSFVFGGLYLRFGLLPSVLLHYSFDVILFAVPLFMSSGVFATLNWVVVLVISLLPLWIALWARFRKGAWGELPERLYNRAWSPQARSVAEPVTSNEARPVLPPVMRGMIMLAGVIGLLAWIALGRGVPDAPGLQISRDRALVIAREELVRRGVKLEPEWQGLVSADTGSDHENRFVWKSSGREVYRQLVGNYLRAPRWKVRFALFSGDIAERAEEYDVVLRGDGDVYSYWHILPESRAGASLNEAKARALAEYAVSERFGKEASGLRVVSSEQNKRPSRLDWLFVWADPGVTLAEGEARISVMLTGSEVSGAWRWVHIPEEWARKERSRKAAGGVLQGVGGVTLVLLSLWITFIAIRGWTRREFSAAAFWKSFVLFLIVGVLSAWNDMAAEIADFSTAQSFNSQLAREILGTAVKLLTMSFVVSAWIGYLHVQVHRQASLSSEQSQADRVTAGLFWGAALTGLMGLSRWLSHRYAPIWPALGGADSSIPAWAGIEDTAQWISAVAFMMLVFWWLDFKFAGRRLWSRALLVVLGFAASGLNTFESWTGWLLSGAMTAVTLLLLGGLVRRTDPRVLLPIFAVVTACSALPRLLYPGFVGAVPATWIGVAGVALVAWIWWRRLSPKSSLPVGE